MPGYASGYPATSAVEVQAPPAAVATPGGDFAAVVPGSDAGAGFGAPAGAPILPDTGTVSFAESGAVPAGAVGLPTAGEAPRIVDAVPIPEGGGADVDAATSPMATMEGLGGDGTGAGFQRIPWLLLGGLALGTWLLMRR
jgi:hypothetical protein